MKTAELLFVLFSSSSALFEVDLVTRCAQREPRLRGSNGVVVMITERVAGEGSPPAAHPGLPMHTSGPTQETHAQK